MYLFYVHQKYHIYALFNLVQCGNKRQRWVDFAPQLPQHCFYLLFFWNGKSYPPKEVCLRNKSHA